MRVSLNTIKQYTDVNLPVDELVHKINAQLGGVEEVVDLNERYKDAVIVHVVKCEKHPDADKLSVCEIDAGTGENVQVVCGAPNVREGMFAIWLPPGSTVPASFGEPEPFVLGERELRGVMSHGMLAAADELGIGTDHTGIVEIDPDEWKPNDVEIKPGISFAEAFSLNDTVIDIENKMFTHRPDLFGQLGVAREIAGIQHHAFNSPDWYKDQPEFERGEGLELNVKNDASDVVPRFMSVAIKNVTVKPSPLWLQCELVRLGGKPINNIVDVTNYVMLLSSQPTHAYDYDKLRGHHLGTRMAHEGETIHLLNGKTYTLDESDIVIVDGEGPVGLAGIMGGGDSEVSGETKNIVLEVATFDMYAVRKSSMRHGLFTDALTRFNKGQSPLQNPYVIALLMKSIFDVAGGEQASEVFSLGTPGESKPVEVTSEFINKRLGLQLSGDEMKKLLENVELKVDGQDTLTVTAPFWRTDIELPEDIVEEVGRLYGFDKLPQELPTRSIKPAPQNTKRELKQTIRDALSRAGANEVLTYSFVHEKTIKRAEQDVSQAFRLSNALSPDLQYYRLSLLPSLLDKVHMNVKAGHDEFALFEIGKAHNKISIGDDGLPAAIELVEMVYASKKPQAGAAYYRTQRLVQSLFETLHVLVTFETIDTPVSHAGNAPYDLTRSSVVKTQSGQVLGMVGELKNSVRGAFKLPEYTAAATLDFSSLQSAASAAGSHYAPLSKFPKVSQDLSLKVPAETTYQTVFDTVQTAIEAVQPENTTSQLSPLGIYQAEDDQAYKTITLRFVIASFVGTLRDADVSQILDHAAQVAAETIHAERG